MSYGRIFRPPHIGQPPYSHRLKSDPLCTVHYVVIVVVIVSCSPQQFFSYSTKQGTAIRGKLPHDEQRKGLPISSARRATSVQVMILNGACVACVFLGRSLSLCLPRCGCQFQRISCRPHVLVKDGEAAVQPECTMVHSDFHNFVTTEPAGAWGGHRPTHRR